MIEEFFEFIDYGLDYFELFFAALFGEFEYNFPLLLFCSVMIVSLAFFVIRRVLFSNG